MGSERISISIPNELLQRFNRIKVLSEVSDRSKVFQIALRDFLDRIDVDSKGGCVGVLTVVYSHEEAGKEVTEIQHVSNNIIVSSLHLHVRGDTCLEAISLKGQCSDIRDLASRVTSIRGVTKVDLVSTPIDDL